MTSTLSDAIAQFESDAALVSRIANGNASTVVQTAGGPVRSLAKLVSDNDASINSSGLLGQVNAAAVTATALAVAAQVAAQAAAVSKGTYTTVSAGIAATTSGQSFFVSPGIVAGSAADLYLNSSGTAQYLASIASSANVAQSMSLNNQVGTASASILWGILDNANRVAVALLPNGKMLLDIDPTSRAYATIQALIAAANAANAFTTISTNNSPIAGTSGGSPSSTLNFAEVHVDSNNEIAYGVLADGTFYIGKYDAKLQQAISNSFAALTANNSPLAGTSVGSGASTLNFAEVHVDSGNKVGYGLLADGTFYIGKYDPQLQQAIAASAVPAVYITAYNNQIIAFAGAGQTVLSSEGNNMNAQVIGAKVLFLSDRCRSLIGSYVMNTDGSNQRRLIRGAAYDGVFVTGQSLAVGATTTPVTTTPPYPTNALMLSTGPVVEGPSTSSPTATLQPLREGITSNKETCSSSFASAVLDTELSQRPTLKMVQFGNGYAGQPYSVIKKGTATYNDVLAQVSRILTFGSLIVRGFIVVHGEADAGNANYDANLIEWQGNYETDIRALTGQSEPLYMFVAQTASIRNYYPTTLNAHQSALKQLAASVENQKIILAVPEYIFSYNDNVHITGPCQRLMGEYLRKAYQKVVLEGRDWRPVSPKTFTLGSNYVDIQFYVPVAPLVLDTALCTDPGNYGFMYSDAAGNTISSVALKAGTQDTVRVTLSGNIGATAAIDYAYNTGTAGISGPTGGARGCLRDSDPALSRWDGTTHLYNPCVIFKQALN